MNPRRRWALASAAAAALGSGCSTGYQRAQHAQADTAALARRVDGVPPPPRALCVRDELQARGRDLSKLTVLVVPSTTVTSPLAGIGHSPQVDLRSDVARALWALGLQVLLPMRDGNFNAKLLMEATVTGFAPLSNSTLGRDEFDLVVAAGEREKLVAVGAVRAVANLYLWTDAAPQLYSSAESAGRFYQFKNRAALNVANKTGWSAGGSVFETIVVHDVQAVATLVVQDAVVTSVAEAFRLSGC